jgi:hypothetical protein
VCHLKLTGYWSKSKDEALRIIAVSKLHSDVYDATGITGQCTNEKEKQPAKTKSCVFCLINGLFSYGMAVKCFELGGGVRTRMCWTVA